MLINDKRALAYTTTIDWVKQIEGADYIDLVGIGGWTCVAKRGEFKPNDLCVYFEIDSKVPADKEWSAFLEKKGYKIKTMKLSKFGVISQGLALPLDAFDVKIPAKTGVDCTELLGVIYSVAEDNERKGAGVDKYKKMAQRRPNIFKKPWARWMMKREWGRRIMFILFGKKKDKKNGWPSWVVKTDEERVQNMNWLFNTEKPTHWIMTEKIDGSSSTFTMRGEGRKREFLVCSRNVVFDKPDKKCFYDTNIYTEMAEKYNMEEVMSKWMQEMKEARKELEFLTIQGEIFGPTVQKRTYGLKGRELAVFNVIFGYKDGQVERLNPYLMAGECELHGLPHVPVLGELDLPATCEEVLDLAAAEGSKIDGGMREGIVFRSMDGAQSFKAVSNEFLLKYHG
jgi:hypothetical protein